MNILRFQTEQLLNEAAAGIFTALVQTNPRAVLGLATGGTPVGIYKELINAYEQGKVSFKEVTTFNLDEYANLDANHEQSYAYYMREKLFAHVDIQQSNIHIPNGKAADLHAESKAYDAKLNEVGHIDLQLLGLGHNGHIGFNEPADHLQNGTHVVTLAEETIQANARFFNSTDEVPKEAITMGVGSILKAHTLMLVVKGADKAEIVHRALRGPITTQCPASLLQTHPRLLVLVDEEAGRLLV